MHFLAISIVASSLALLPICTSLHAAELHGLGLNTSSPVVSDDGTAVAGYLDEGGFYWTEASGLTELGFLPDDNRVEVLGISGDGRVVVGHSRSVTSKTEGFYWTSAAGMVGIGYLKPQDQYSFVSAASADGQVLVGYSSSGTGFGEAFRWTESEGPVGLGLYPGGETSLALDVSGDGNTIVGHDFNQDEAFYWNARDGVMRLGKLDGSSWSKANSVSDDGLVVAGNSDGPFRWTPEGGMVALGLDPEATGGWANAISGDGRVVVGEAFFPLSGEEGNCAFGFSNCFAAIWVDEMEMRRLDKVIAGSFDLNGWQLINATGISADRTVVVGNGINPEKAAEAWRMVLDTPLTVRFSGSPLDCNGDGLASQADLACSNSEGTTETLLADLGMLAGDFDGVDGVAFADFLLLSGNFGLTTNSYLQGDIDGNGMVDFGDFLELSANFGQTSEAAFVPEPAAAEWLSLQCCFLLLARRRRS